MTTSQATDKQISFVAKLLSEKDVSALLADQAESVIVGAASVKYASGVIDDLLKCKKATVVAAPVVDEISVEGFFLSNGVVYRTKRSKTSGKLYAKRLIIHGNHVEWEYAPGAFSTLTMADAMTAEQAAEYGAQTGHCAYCGRKLEDDISRAYYMGPVCATKYAGIKRSTPQSAYAKAREILIARGETPSSTAVAAVKAAA